MDDASRSPDAVAAARQRERAGAATLIDRGVVVRDPETLYLRGSLTCGVGVSVDVNVIVEGDVVLEDHVAIGPNCILRACRIGARTEVREFSTVEKSVIGEACRVGSYARVRPDCVIGSRVQIGNFVEIKTSTLGDGVRINHHSFIGDADLAADVTIGAGTITCNHDGVGTNPTVIGAGAYIGSGCHLIAPLRIGAGATIGAGSTITRDVPPGKLTLARTPQATLDNWAGPKRRTDT